MGDEATIVLVNRSRGTILFDQTLLQSDRWKLRLATRGTEAWRITRETAPRLVVMSYDLDDLRAPELCRLIRDHERTKRISLLLLGERSEQDEADLCRAAGCNDVLYRPLHKTELHETVARLISIPLRRTVRTLTHIDLGEGGPTLLGHTLNLSATGMLLQVDRTLPPAAELMLQFFLENNSRPIRVRSEVVRAEFTGGAPRYGVRFLQLANEQKTMIDMFVRQDFGVRV